VGRHSSEQKSNFYRSVLLWAVPWLVIAAIVGIAVWFAVGALSGTEVTTNAPPAQGSTDDATEAPSTPTPTPEESPQTRSAKPSKSPSPKPDGDLITQDISVQVLNGTGGMPGAAESMAARLRQRGFEIAAVGDALTVDRTVVYWSGTEDERAARVLARAFGWAAGPAPQSLSEVVDVHVVVGPDEPPR
jgi:LytR cell envelope-related transcriptional attenuator